MSAQLLLLRPFQSARQAAKSAGLDDSNAIRKIREAQSRGSDGYDIAGELRTRDWHIRNGYSVGPRDPTT
jgi:hypothetical protein